MVNFLFWDIKVHFITLVTFPSLLISAQSKSALDLYANKWEVKEESFWMPLKMKIAFSYLEVFTVWNRMLKIISGQDFIRILRSFSVCLVTLIIPLGERNRMLAPGLETGCSLKTFISTNLGHRGCQGQWIWLWFLLQSI